MQRDDNARLALAVTAGLVAGFALATFELLAVALLWTFAATAVLAGLAVVLNTALYARRRPQVTPTHPERRRVL